VTVLAAEGLRHAYGDRVVVDGVSVSVSAGEVVGVVGPNGAGKTTAFLLLAGVLPVREGRVVLGDRDVTALPLEGRARAGLGYLPQEPSVFRGLTAIENVVVGLEAAGVPRAERPRRAAELLEEVGIGPMGSLRADRLSGGERRRLEIARLLAIRPGVLLLDEPFTGLDPLAAAGMRTLLSRVARGGVGVLLTDHNVGVALPACDRAVLLVEGRVRFVGTSEELAADRGVREVYLGGHPVRQH
jgi:lipopolysaccharide export system ATP-binding protein